eukprot:COSAG01_NODE_5319_length_4335_cov_48.955619_3_plen_110_part_00
MHTEVSRNFPRALQLGYWLSQPLMYLLEKTPMAGARTSVHVATSPSLRGVGGRYFVNSADAPPNSMAHDEAAAARLWAMSETLTTNRRQSRSPSRSPRRSPSRRLGTKA